MYQPCCSTALKFICTHLLTIQGSQICFAAQASDMAISESLATCVSEFCWRAGSRWGKGWLCGCVLRERGVVSKWWGGHGEGRRQTDRENMDRIVQNLTIQASLAGEHTF